MLSNAGRYFNRIKIVKPMSGEQRKKMYESLEVKVPKRKKMRRDVSFDSIPRSVEDSYFLRHRKEMVVSSNYHPKHSQTIEASPRPVMAKAQFTRMIGDVRGEDYSLPLQQNCNHRCKKAHEPLTLPYIGKRRAHCDNNGDAQYDDIQLKKLAQSVNEHSMKSQIKDMKSTRDSFVHKTLDASTHLMDQSLLKHKPKFTQNRAHKFESDSAHQFLKDIYDGKYQMPDYDIANNKHEGIIRRSMIQPKGHVKFDRFRDRESVKGRYDRVDPEWHCTIETIETEKVLKHRRVHKSLNMGQSIDRQPNEVYSKYPIRQSLSKILNRSHI